MSLKTVPISVPEIGASNNNNLFTANAGENATITSLFVTHKNDPTRADITNNSASNVVDLKIGCRTEGSYLGATEISEGFQLIVGSDKEYDSNSTANRGNIYIQLQKYINGSIVTGRAYNLMSVSGLGTYNYTNSTFQAFEIYSGMILLILSNGSVGAIAVTFNYNATSLALTSTNNTLTLSKTWFIAAEKIVDGRVYYIGKTANNSTTPNTLNLLKITNTGVITETAGVLSGFNTSGGNDNTGPNIYSTCKSICRATLDSNQFLIATVTTSNNLNWLVVQFNTADDSTTLINRVNYTSITLTTHPTVIPAYESTGFKVIILCPTINTNSSGNNVLIINSSTAVAPVTTSTPAINLNSGNFNSLRLNMSNRRAFMTVDTAASTNDTRIMTITWFSSNNNLNIFSYPIVKPDYSLFGLSGVQRDIGFLSFFNNTLYIAGTIYNTYFSRLEPTTGQMYEVIKLYTGTPILDSTRVKWSNYYNGYVVAVKNQFYLFDIAGNLLTVTSLPTSIYNYSIGAFDISPTGTVCIVCPNVATITTGPNYPTSNHIYFEMSLNLQRNTPAVGVVTGGSITNYFTQGDTGGTSYSGLIQDLICLDTGCVFAIKSNTTNYYILAYYVSYGYAANNTTLSAAFNSAVLGAASTLVFWHQARLLRITSNSFRLIYSNPNTPYLYSVGYIKNSNNTLVNNNPQLISSLGFFLVYDPFYNNIALAGTNESSIFTGSDSSCVGLVTMLAGNQAIGIRFVYIDGNNYIPYYSMDFLIKVTAARIGSFMGVLEEYGSSRVFRLFDERTGPLAVEITSARVISNDSASYSTTAIGAAALDSSGSILNFYGFSKGFSLKVPGTGDFTVDLKILKADGTTIVPVVSAYPVKVGATFSLGNSPIYLASGDSLQGFTSKASIGAASGYAITRLNQANAT